MPTEVSRRTEVTGRSTPAPSRHRVSECGKNRIGLRGLRHTGSSYFVGVWDAWAASGESFLYEAEDGAAVLRYGFEPCEASHLGEIDTSETKPGDQNVDAIAERLVRDGVHCFCNRFRTVRFRP